MIQVATYNGKEIKYNGKLMAPYFLLFVRSLSHLK